MTWGLKCGNYTLIPIKPLQKSGISVSIPWMQMVAAALWAAEAYVGEWGAPGDSDSQLEPASMLSSQRKGPVWNPLVLVLYALWVALSAFWMMFSNFPSGVDTLKQSVSGWRGSGRSWKKNPWGVITDVGITFAVGITSAEAGLRLLLRYLPGLGSGMLGRVLPSNFKDIRTSKKS